MDNYSKAYKEVIEVLKYVPKEDVDKIPKDIIKTFEEKMDNEYDFKIDESKEFKEQILLLETKGILANIFLDYWANEEEKQKINEIYLKVDRKLEEEKVKKYNPNNLFNNKENDKKKKEEFRENKEVTTYKELKWYNRFLDFIKNILDRL